MSNNSKIPSFWILCSLEDVASDVSYGYTAKSSDQPIGPHLLRITDIQDNKVDWTGVPYCKIDEKKLKSYLLEKGDLLFARTGATVGKSFLIDSEIPDSVYASYLIRVRCIQKNGIRYLAYFFKSSEYWKQITEFSAGIGQPNVNGTKLRGLSIPLPPLAEQKEIAVRLDEMLGRVDRLKARLDAIPAILKRFRQSVLSAATSGKLTEDWREENPQEPRISTLIQEVEKAKKGLLKVRNKQGNEADLSFLDLPSSWEWTPNHKLAEDSSTAICAGPFGTIFKAKDFRTEGVPIIFLRHVKEDGFNQNKPNYMDPKVWERLHQEYSVHGGELLVTKLGDPPGESCIYPENNGVAMVTPDVLKMNVDTRLAESEYLMHFFNSAISKKIMSEMAFGVTRLRIDIAMFKNFPIPLPPRREQTEIVRRVEELFGFADRVEGRVLAAQQRVDRLTQSILAKAFRGDLTADWRAAHPDLITGEDSAQSLLQQIQQARQSLNTKKRAKKTAKKRVARA